MSRGMIEWVDPDSTVFAVDFRLDHDEPEGNLPHVESYDGVVTLGGVEVWRHPVRFDTRFASPFNDNARRHAERIVMGTFARRLADVLAGHTEDGPGDA